MDELKDEMFFEENLSQDDIASKLSISCTNVPESLFDTDAAMDHFSKFGIISKIHLRPKKQSCIVTYEKRSSAEKAVLNGGAYDGFLFDVTFNKRKIKRSLVNEDPDWLPDSEVAAELAAMTRESQIPKVPRLNRQQKMEIDRKSAMFPPKWPIVKKPVMKNNDILKKKIREPPKEANVPPVAVATQPTRVLDREELRLLVSRGWNGTEERIKALEMRDRVVRSRLPPRRGAIKGCCPDMCPERERLLRQSQKQIAGYEFNPDEPGNVDPRRVVKQYSRSSADQEEPLAHELRPVPVLRQTLVYLLHHIMDLSEKPDHSLEDWFHFMWDRLRSIRKDITQQAMCCAGSVSLVEACARFHAHCAARLVEEPPSSFDQRLNTENLSKCLQSLKYMYGDLRAHGDTQACAREPEFRAYVVLLNMHDSNFMWEVQKLDPEVQRSPEIRFAIKVFTALDNNNYIKFFKLVKETTYLNACILHRYFNDVRARALTRMIKSYSYRGISQFPSSELQEMLGFESLEVMELFLDHYGLQLSADQEPFVILSKNAFCDNDTPYAQERAVSLIESKRTHSLGKTVYGEDLPPSHFSTYKPHNSFDGNSYINKKAILAEDQGCSPSSEVIEEITNILKGAPTVVKKLPEPTKPQQDNSNNRMKPAAAIPREKPPDFTFAKPETVDMGKTPTVAFGQNVFNKPTIASNIFSQPSTVSVNLFKPAVDGGDSNIFKVQPGNLFSKTENKFVFSKPVAPEPVTSGFNEKTLAPSNIFTKGVTDPAPPFSASTNIFGSGAVSSSNIFAQPVQESKPGNVFATSTNIFSAKPASSIFGGTEHVSSDVAPTPSGANIFGQAASMIPPSGLFGNNSTASNIFGNAVANIPTLFNSNAVSEEEENRKLAEIFKKKMDEEIRFEKENQRREEMQKQEMLKRKLEEEKRIAELEKIKAETEKKMAAELAVKKAAELERLRLEKIEREKLAEKKKRDFEMEVDKQSQSLVPEVIDEVIDDMCRSLIEEEIDRVDNLNDFASFVCDEIIREICDEECKSGLQAAKRLYELRLRIVARAASRRWRRQVAKSNRRRSLLYTTPTWLPSQSTPSPRALPVHALQRMRDFHRGKLHTAVIPEKRKKETINLFETVKKSLLRRSQEIKRISFSLNVSWKLTTSLPETDESPEYSQFLRGWIKDIFVDDLIQKCSDPIIYLNEHYWYKKFCISICSISGSENFKKKYDFHKAVDGSSGLLFYANLTVKHLPLLMKRIHDTVMSKNDSEPIPIGLIVLSQRPHEISALESKLIEYKNSQTISDFKITKLSEFSDEQLTAATKEMLKWAAKRYPIKPPLEMNLLRSVLDQCLGDELWGRFKSTCHSSYREMFRNPSSITDLYNEAVDKTAKIIGDRDMKKYSTFPSELKSFLPSDDVYPKEYEYFQSDWKNSIGDLDNEIDSFKIQHYRGEWPPISIESFNSAIKKYIVNLNWYSDPNVVTLKVMSTIEKDFNNDDISDYKHDDKYSWIDIMNVLIREKIHEKVLSLKNPQIVYKKHVLESYRTSPWWYRSKLLRNFNPLPEEHSDGSNSDLDTSDFKRPKLEDNSDEKMPDDLWTSTILSDLDESIKRNDQITKMFSELEETLLIQEARQSQLEQMVRAALEDN